MDTHDENERYLRHHHNTTGMLDDTEKRSSRIITAMPTDSNVKPLSKWQMEPLKEGATHSNKIMREQLATAKKQNQSTAEHMRKVLNPSNTSTATSSTTVTESTTANANTNNVTSKNKKKRDRNRKRRKKNTTTNDTPTSESSEEDEEVTVSAVKVAASKSTNSVDNNSKKQSKANNKGDPGTIAVWNPDRKAEDIVCDDCGFSNHGWPGCPRNKDSPSFTENDAIWTGCWRRSTTPYAANLQHPHLHGMGEIVKKWRSNAGASNNETQPAAAATSTHYERGTN